MRFLMVMIVVVVAFLDVAFADDEGAVKLTRDELLAFLPGAKATRVKRDGGVDSWTNGADGTFMMLSRHGPSGPIKAMIHTETHSGTWLVNDEGEYCVNIGRRFKTEQWCAFILKAAEGSYYLNLVNSGHKIEFSH